MGSYLQNSSDRLGHPFPSGFEDAQSRPTSPSISSAPSQASSGKMELLADYLFRKCDQQKWFEQDNDLSYHELQADYLGIILRSGGESYYSEPAGLLLNSMLLDVIRQLRVPAAMTMRSKTVVVLLNEILSNQSMTKIDLSGVTLHIVETVADINKTLMNFRPYQTVYLCKSEGFLLTFAEHGQALLKRGSYVEDLMIGYLFGGLGSGPEPNTDLAPIIHPVNKPLPTIQPSIAQFLPDLPQAAFRDVAWQEKVNAIQVAINKEQQGDEAFDPEKDGQEAPQRKFLLNHAIMVGFAMVLTVVVEMACIAKMVREVQLDGSYTRFALAATVPLFATFSLFFMIVTSGSLWQIFGPVSPLKKNSKYYSAVAPKPARYPGLELPHITIQMPVYKEGLQNVIIPTIMSVMAAVKKYETHGGTATIYVNDDGMQLVGKDLADARKAYYSLNNIGWCARPPHNDTTAKKKTKKWRKNKDSEKVDLGNEDSGVHFVRKGKFKKASNMNYCLDFSLRVDDECSEMAKRLCEQRSCTEDDLTAQEEDLIYEQARDQILQSDGGKTWASGDVRVGSYILIIDSDTRVPEDCLLYGALEMHESPEVALIQHASGIMQVVHNAFENGIAFFTNLVYTSIQFAVGNGDCAPFVGHNTFIRWDALQSISWFDEDDQCTKFWSDSHVSEDFDVSLRLQMNDFVVRLATYHDGGFKEGVSLTVYDEIARWEKYAYGCNELVFNPLYMWPYRGPFTRLFLRFIFSKIKVTSKITIFAYIGTYYAMASAIPLSLANYLIVGWFANEIDQFYLTSWQVFVGMVVVFNVLSPVGYSMLRHRLGKATFFDALFDGIKWTPMFLLFFGGVSFHLLKAICCHFFSINMEWTTTAKEYSGGFRVGLDRIIRDFKWMYLVITMLTGGMIYLACFAPYGWTIKDFSAIVPLANQVGCHALLPFALGLF
ncbi:hypothetical protein LTS07_010319 [Exophiala sideris]|nr:hypothetical protein LTS07_010319 [Exophiala sideris]